MSSSPHALVEFRKKANGYQNSSEKVNDQTLIPPPDWEALISQTAKEILEERSPARLMQVRARLYDLLSHCIPPSTVIKVWRQLCTYELFLLTCAHQTLTFMLVAQVDDALKPEVIKWSAFYEHRIKQGSVSISSRIITLSLNLD